MNRHARISLLSQTKPSAVFQSTLLYRSIMLFMDRVKSRVVGWVGGVVPQVYDNESHPLLAFDPVSRRITVDLSVLRNPFIPKQGPGSYSLPQVQRFWGPVGLPYRWVT